MSNPIVDKVLAEHREKLRQAQEREENELKENQEPEEAPVPQEPTEPEADERFFSVVRGEGVTEDFFEIRFRTGTQTCFPYHDLQWFNYSKDDSVIDLGFGLFIVEIKGRGLVPRLFSAIKSKRLAWVREADTEMQDSPEFECYIESITLTPPQGADDGEEEEA